MHSNVDYMFNIHLVDPMRCYGYIVHKLTHQQLHLYSKTGVQMHARKEKPTFLV